MHPIANIGHRATAPVLILLLLLWSPAGNAQTTAPTEATAPNLVAKIGDYMDAAARVDRFSGTILVARGGVPIVTRSYGAANVELEVPNTATTVFKLGSIAKSFTAVAILQLQEDGKLSVSDSICKHLADCPETWKPITIHHLLTHSAGIPNFTALREYPKMATVPVTHPEMMARLRGLPLEFVPGEKGAYNNSAYYLAGMIIENVSGKPYGEFLRERIFNPLGMNSSGYDRPREIVKGRAAGYEIVDGQLMNAPYLDMSVPFASGSIYSTAGDLLLFDQALYTDKLLKKVARDQAFQAYVQGRGYGWSVRRQFDRFNIEKDGGISGFQSNLSRYPDDGVTVIVLGNNQSASATRIATDLGAIVFGAHYELPAPRKEISLAADVLANYTGRYKLSSGREVAITLEQGKLIRIGEDGSRRELVPESASQFFVRNRDVTITFRFDIEGRVTGFVVETGGRETTAERMP